MVQDYQTIYTTALSLLTAIITGGFVLIYVELSNKKTRETDRYEQLMRPFMHKLSAYFRFVSWVSNKIIVPKENLKGGEKDFKQIIDTLSSYGSRSITSGGDYKVSSFTANQLYDISYGMINHIWYLTHHRHWCNLQWDSRHDFGDEYIRKELIEINPNYKDLPITLDNFIKVSADFHADTYLMIEADTEIHESRLWLLSRHTVFVITSFSATLLLLCAMLFFHLPGWSIQVLSLIILISLFISLLMLGIDYSTQIKYYNKYAKYKDSIKRKLKFNK